MVKKNTKVAEKLKKADEAIGRKTSCVSSKGITFCKGDHVTVNGDPNNTPTSITLYEIDYFTKDGVVRFVHGQNCHIDRLIAYNPPSSSNERGKEEVDLSSPIGLETPREAPKPSPKAPPSNGSPWKRNREEKFTSTLQNQAQEKKEKPKRTVVQKWLSEVGPFRILEITNGGTSEYLCEAVSNTSYRLTKLEPGRTTCYNVLIGKLLHCGCEGFSRRNECKHVDCLLHLRKEGKL